MKKYEAPKLFVDNYAADTMIASGGNPKNSNADNNQNCWGCNSKLDEINGDDQCTVLPSDELYAFC